MNKWKQVYEVEGVAASNAAAEVLEANEKYMELMDVYPTARQAHAAGRKSTKFSGATGYKVTEIWEALDKAPWTEPEEVEHDEELVTEVTEEVEEDNAEVVTEEVETEQEQPEPEEVKELTTKQYVKALKRDEVIVHLDEFGVEYDEDAKVDELKPLLIEAIDVAKADQAAEEVEQAE